MPASKLAVATRAFVSVLLALARAYDLALQVNRDSAHDAILRAYWKVVQATAFDQGGLHCQTQGHHALSESTGGRQELCRKVPQNVQAGRRSWRRWSRHLSA